MRYGFLTALIILTAAGCEQRQLIPERMSTAVPVRVICIPEKATEAEKNAADELRLYFAKITGVPIPVVSEAKDHTAIAYVGRTRFADSRFLSHQRFTSLDDDGFIVETHGDAIVLCGKKDWGTEFAVYYFLQKYCGVRWFMPTELGEVVPRTPALKIPAGIADRQEPDWKSRLYSGVAGAHAVWAKRNLMRGRFNFHHNLLNIIVPSKYAATHPDFFPLINGKRYLPKKNDDHSWQPCMSNPAVVMVCAEAAREYFTKNPDAVSFSLGINDSNGYCQCDKCKAMDVPGAKFRDRPNMSDRVFAFMNAVAAELAKTHPDKYLGCLAYSWCEALPTRVKVSPMIIPYLTNDRAQWRDRRFMDHDKQLIQQWTRATPNVSIYDYYYGSGYVIPRVHTRTIDESLSYCRSKGVKGFYAELYPNWGLDGPKAWLAAQLLWRANQSRDRLLDDYYTSFFGKAAGPMRKFFTACEDAWMKQPGQAVWFKGFFKADQMDMFPPERIAELEKLLKEARSLAAADPVRRRVEFVATAFGYTKRFADMYWASRKVSGASVRNMDEAKSICALVARTLTARKDLESYFEDVIQKDPLQAPRIPFFERSRYDPLQNLGPAFLSAASWAETSGKWNDFAAELTRIESAAGGNIGPYASAVRYLHDHRASLQNLMPNPGFEEIQGKAPPPQGVDWDSSNTPPGWSRWNRPGTEADLQWRPDGGRAGKRCVLLKGATAACYITRIAVKPGEKYYCAAYARATGSPDAEVELLVQWQNQSGWVSKPPASSSLSGADRRAWTHLVTIFTVPEGVTQAVIGLNVGDQARQDTAWFDDVELYRIP